MPDWDVYLDQAAEDNFAPTVGTLTETAKEADASVTGSAPARPSARRSRTGRTEDWQPLRERGEVVSR